MNLADGPLWSYLHNNRRARFYSAELRQSSLDVLELGTRAAAWLAKDDGGIYRLTGYQATPPRLVELLERVGRRTPGKGPRLKVVR